MAATVTLDTYNTNTSTSTKSRSLWRSGLKAGLVAAVATTAVAAVASAAGVSLVTEPGGEAIPALGFGQITLFFTVIGLVIASVIARRARRPRTMWLRTAITLTALSIVPDVVLNTDSATKATLAFTHVIAAAIIIPAVSGRLARCR